jgi:hypothetical protein
MAAIPACQLVNRESAIALWRIAVTYWAHLASNASGPVRRDKYRNSADPNSGAPSAGRGPRRPGGRGPPVDKDRIVAPSQKRGRRGRPRCNSQLQRPSPSMVACGALPASAMAVQANNAAGRVLVSRLSVPGAYAIAGRRRPSKRTPFLDFGHRDAVKAGGI